MNRHIQGGGGLGITGDDCQSDAECDRGLRCIDNKCGGKRQRTGPASYDEDHIASVGVFGDYDMREREERDDNCKNAEDPDEYCQRLGFGYCALFDNDQQPPTEKYGLSDEEKKKDNIVGMCKSRRGFVQHGKKHRVILMMNREPAKIINGTVLESAPITSFWAEAKNSTSTKSSTRMTTMMNSRLNSMVV